MGSERGLWLGPGAGPQPSGPVFHGEIWPSCILSLAPGALGQQEGGRTPRLLAQEGSVGADGPEHHALWGRMGRAETSGSFPTV